MGEPEIRPAYYAAQQGPVHDWWTLLHPPYTAWHLSYVVIGAMLAPDVDAWRLLATLLAFFAAVGVAAHALDERNGRPLRTGIPAPVLTAAAGGGLAVALGLGLAGVVHVGWWLAPFVVLGPVLVVGYNLELFAGRLHSDWAFALSWGAFPVLTAYVAQAGELALAAVAGAAGATAVSYAQRSLSTPARALRRRVIRVDGTAVHADGQSEALSRTVLLAPYERALRAMSWGMVMLATALAIARLA
jgi:hypothetical protein